MLSIGGYAIVGEINRNNRSVVYMCKDKDGVVVAVKVWFGESLSRYKMRFVSSIRNMARMQHLRIVRPFAMGTFEDDGEKIYLCMEYMAGGNVRNKYLVGTRLPLEIILDYVMQIASALHYAHQQDIIHENLKPENILFREDGGVVLSDFGFNETFESPEGYVSVPGLPYMPPEQIRGWSEKASDQYALGAMMYKWICGVPPFEGLKSILDPETEPGTFMARGVNVSPQVEQVVMKALAKKPEMRFPDVMNFALALNQAILHNRINFDIV